MIKAASTVGNYTLVFSGDSALDLPDDAEERERVLELARNTGDWQAITREGSEQPTVFHFKPITGTAYQWWAGQTARNQLIGVESASLALRLGIIDVKNFGKHEVRRFKNDDQQELANTKIIDAIYAEAGAAMGIDIVVELGTLVIDRARAGIPPLSSKG